MGAGLLCQGQGALTFVYQGRTFLCDLQLGPAVGSAPFAAREEGLYADVGDGRGRRQFGSLNGWAKAAACTMRPGVSDAHAWNSVRCSINGHSLMEARRMLHGDGGNDDDSARPPPRPDSQPAAAAARRRQLSPALPSSRPPSRQSSRPPSRQAQGQPRRAPAGATRAGNARQTPVRWGDACPPLKPGMECVDELGSFVVPKWAPYKWVSPRVNPERELWEQAEAQWKRLSDEGTVFDLEEEMALRGLLPDWAPDGAPSEPKLHSHCDPKELADDAVAAPSAAQQLVTLTVPLDLYSLVDDTRRRRGGKGAVPTPTALSEVVEAADPAPSVAQPAARAPKADAAASPSLEGAISSTPPIILPSSLRVRSPPPRAELVVDLRSCQRDPEELPERAETGLARMLATTGTLANGRLAVRASTLAGQSGLGLFACVPFARGSCVTEYNGTLLHKSSIDDIPRSHMLRISDSDYVIDGRTVALDIDREAGTDETGGRTHLFRDPRLAFGGMGPMANCQPKGVDNNVRVHFVDHGKGEGTAPRRAFFVAKVDIAAGDEIFFDYGTEGAMGGLGPSRPVPFCMARSMTPAERAAREKQRAARRAAGQSEDEIIDPVAQVITLEGNKATALYHDLRDVMIRGDCTTGISLPPCSDDQMAAPQEATVAGRRRRARSSTGGGGGVGTAAGAGAGVGAGSGFSGRTAPRDLAAELAERGVFPFGAFGAWPTITYEVSEGGSSDDGGDEEFSPSTRRLVRSPASKQGAPSAARESSRPHHSSGGHSDACSGPMDASAPPDDGGASGTVLAAPAAQQPAYTLVPLPASEHDDEAPFEGRMVIWDDAGAHPPRALSPWSGDDL